MDKKKVLTALGCVAAIVLIFTNDKVRNEAKNLFEKAKDKVTNMIK